MLPLPNACPKKGIRNYRASECGELLRRLRPPVPEVTDFSGWAEWGKSFGIWTVCRELPGASGATVIPAHTWDVTVAIVAPDSPYPVFTLCHEFGHVITRHGYPPIFEDGGRFPPLWTRHPAEGSADEFAVCLAIGKKEFMGRLKAGESIHDLAREWQFPIRALELRARLAGCRFV